MTPESLKEGIRIRDDINKLKSCIDRVERIIRHKGAALMLSDRDNMQQDIFVSEKTRDMVYQLCLFDMKEQLAKLEQEFREV